MKARLLFLGLGILSAGLGALGWVVFGFQHPSALTLTAHCVGKARIECLSEVFRKEVVTHGLAPAFDTFTELYREDKSFSKVCHITTHAIGAEAYRLYVRGALDIPRGRIAYCGYGFYHGFIIELLSDTRDIPQARAFCEYLASSTSRYGVSTLASCLHGFGHGISDYLPAEELKKDADKSIESQLGTCRTIGKNTDEYEMCAGGVYNALGEAMMALKKNVPTAKIADLAHPYVLCERQPDQSFRNGCFRNFNSVLAFNTRDNVIAAIPELVSIRNTKEAQLAMLNFTDYEARLLGGKDELLPLRAAECYTAPRYLQVPCIQGYVDGIIEFATPEREYESALAFCESTEIRDSDKEACYARVNSSTRSRYSDATYRAICAQFPEQYQRLCK